jgi:hypothetical protein
VARAHWKTYLPKKYKELEQTRQLNRELEAAVAMTLEEMADYRSAGATADEAWQMAREHHVIVKEEVTASRT